MIVEYTVIFLSFWALGAFFYIAITKGCFKNDVIGTCRETFLEGEKAV